MRKKDEKNGSIDAQEELNEGSQNRTSPPSTMKQLFESLMKDQHPKEAR